MSKDKTTKDEFYTPREAVEEVLEAVLPEKVMMPVVCRYDVIVWCPFDTEESNFVKVLRERGYRVICSHIDTGQDFFEYEPKEWHYLISNPPFSQFTKIVKKLDEFNKPFLILSNFARLIDKRKFLKKHKCNLIIPSKRIKFISENNYTPSATCWVSNFNKNTAPTPTIPHGKLIFL